MLGFVKIDVREIAIGTCRSGRRWRRLVATRGRRSLLPARMSRSLAWTTSLRHLLLREQNAHTISPKLDRPRALPLAELHRAARVAPRPSSKQPNSLRAGPESGDVSSARVAARHIAPIVFLCVCTVSVSETRCRSHRQSGPTGGEPSPLTVCRWWVEPWYEEYQHTCTMSMCFQVL